MQRSMVLAGKSESTLLNYARCLAKMALHFQASPLELDEEQVKDYLYLVKTEHQTPSDSFFKHTIYGLRYAYRMEGKTPLALQLPSIARPKQLPVVLSTQEVKALLSIPRLLKHRLILAILYGCGLRSFELCQLRIADLDLDRQMLHVRQGKGRKDRYVPLCTMLCRGIRKYLQAERPQVWLFNGKDPEGKIRPFTTRGVQWVVKEARKRSGISKAFTAHTLRHSYATHLLEMGLDIISLKDLLGHERVETTLIYLHVSQLGRKPPFSPLERLYDLEPQKP